MSRYDRNGDNGSFGTGLIIAVWLIAFYWAGYYTRHKGYVFQFNKTPTTQEIQAK